MRETWVLWSTDSPCCMRHSHITAHVMLSCLTIWMSCLSLIPEQLLLIGRGVKSRLSLVGHVHTEKKYVISNLTDSLSTPTPGTYLACLTLYLTVWDVLVKMPSLLPESDTPESVEYTTDTEAEPYKLYKELHGTIPNYSEWSKKFRCFQSFSCKYALHVHTCTVYAPHCSCHVMCCCLQTVHLDVFNKHFSH